MNVGRPRKYNTPEEMQSAIDDYFDSCKPEFIKDEKNKVIMTSKGTPLMDLNPPTITGLALHLGFVNRQSMYDYENNKEFSDTIKRARTRCENFLEKTGISGQCPPAMAIFGLKNYGWSDKQELEHTTPTGLDIKVEFIKPENT